MLKNPLKLILLPKELAKSKEQQKKSHKEGRRLKERLEPALIKSMEVLEGDESEEYKKQFFEEMNEHFLKAAEILNKDTKFWDINPSAYRNIFFQRKSRFDEN